MTERYAYDKGNCTVRDTVTRAVKYDELDPYSGAIVANAMNELDATQAENDALRAQLKAANAKFAAVPIGPIRRWYENSNPQMMEYEFIADIETDAEFIEAWLATQVQP